MNGIQGSSAASWAQFVKLKQAARERNSGFSLDGVANTGRNEKTAPKRGVRNAYFEQRIERQNGVNVSAVEENENIKGNNFDAYA